MIVAVIAYTEVITVLTYVLFRQDAYLLWVCYVILFFCATFCAVSMPVGESRRVMAEGVWQVI